MEVRRSGTLEVWRHAVGSYTWRYRGFGTLEARYRCSDMEVGGLERWR
jgi:hypothetical protein